jgi:excisionase family DNA binding protein
MEPEDLIAISEAAERIGVSIDTLRRWDEAGKLRAIRKSPGGNRYYSEKELEIFLHDLFKLAYEWATGSSATDLPPTFYCADSGIFKARLTKMETALMGIPTLQKEFPLIVAITAEIGDNSFSHNIGNWPDATGIFFGYDIHSREVVLADRGVGVLQTLKRVRSELTNYPDALNVAFNEIVSGREPEQRGNGLKFVKKVVAENPISLFFQSGDTELEIHKKSNTLNIRGASQFLRGCLARILF